MTKPGIPDGFDIIQIPFGMSPVDSQGPSLSSPGVTLPVLQSQGTQLGEDWRDRMERDSRGEEHANLVLEGQQRGTANLVLQRYCCFITSRIAICFSPHHW